MASPYGVIYTLLAANTNITALVTAADNVIKIFPSQVPQKYPMPAIVIDIVSVVPSNTKDGASAFDTIQVQVTMIATTRIAVEELSALVRSTLDFVNHQTIASVVVNYIKFAGENDIQDTMSGQDGLALKYQEYTLTINR